MSFKSTKQKYKSKYVFRVCFKGEDYLVNKMLDYSELDNNSFDEPFYFRSTLDELALYRYYFKKKYCTWQSPILNVRSKADENIILNYVAENNIFHSIQIVYSNDTLYEHDIFHIDNKMINLVRHKTFKIYTDENTFTNGQIPQLYYNSLNSIGLGLISPINRSISDSTVRFKMEIHQQILNKINWINSFTVD